MITIFCAGFCLSHNSLVHVPNKILYIKTWKPGNSKINQKTWHVKPLPFQAISLFGHCFVLLLIRVILNWIKLLQENNSFKLAFQDYVQIESWESYAEPLERCLSFLPFNCTPKIFFWAFIPYVGCMTAFLFEYHVCS